MKLYKILTAYILYLGMPSYLTYLAYKAVLYTATIFPFDQAERMLIVPAMTFICAVIIIEVSIGDIIKTYVKENN